MVVENYPDVGSYYLTRTLIQALRTGVGTNALLCGICASSGRQSQYLLFGEECIDILFQRYCICFWS
jgi:hypothetical protein